MRTYMGIVCEKSKNEMIFMTNEGEFLRGIPLSPNPEIGDEVEFQLVATSSLHSKRKSTFIWPALVASMLLIFLVSSFIPQTKNVHAYVQLGNEIELGLDKDGNILFVQSLIEEKTIEMDTLEGLPVTIALSKVIKEVSPTNENIEITTRYVKQYNEELKVKIDKAVSEVRIVPSQKSTNYNRTNPEEKTRPNHGETNQNNKNKVQQPPLIEQKINEKQLEKPMNNKRTKEQSNNPNRSNKINEKQDNPSHQEKSHPNSETQNKSKSNKLDYEKTNPQSANNQKQNQKSNQHTNNNSNNNQEKEK